MKLDQSCCSAVTASAASGLRRTVERAFWHSFSRLTRLSKWKASSSFLFFAASSEELPVLEFFAFSWPFVCCGCCCCCRCECVGVGVLLVVVFVVLDTKRDVVALFHMTLEVELAKGEMKWKIESGR